MNISIDINVSIYIDKGRIRCINMSITANMSINME